MPSMATSMSSTNKIPEDRSTPTATTNDTPGDHATPQEAPQPVVPDLQNLDDIDEPRQADQGEGIEALRHIIGLQTDRVVSMNKTIDELNNLVEYIYKHTCTNAILQSHHDVRLAALRADSTRATVDNMIQRHTHSIRQIHQKMTELQREQAAQTSRIIEVESRLDALVYMLETVKDKLQQLPMQQREDPHIPAIRQHRLRPRPP